MDTTTTTTGRGDYYVSARGGEYRQVFADSPAHAVKKTHLTFGTLRVTKRSYQPASAYVDFDVTDGPNDWLVTYQK